MGALHELRICQNVLCISHLLFTNDTLMFMKAIGDWARVVETVSRHYERCTKQLINPVKCSILFGSGCLQADQERVQ
jgi:glycogen synthase